MSTSHLDPFLTFIVDRFRDDHKCHTVILYGSRARGDANETSDYDVIGIRNDGAAIRDTQVHAIDRILDGFLYPKNDVLGKERDFLRIVDGLVLFEEDGFGTQLLETVKTIHAKGPDPYPETEAKACRDWVKKMLLRSRNGDLEGNFRRHWLLFQLLEDYFLLRNQWFMGAKQGLKYLRAIDPETYRLYEIAAMPGASMEEIEALASRVVSVQES